MLYIYIAFYAYIFIAKIIKKVKIIFDADIISLAFKPVAGKRETVTNK